MLIENKKGDMRIAARLRERSPFAVASEMTDLQSPKLGIELSGIIS